MPQTEYDSSSPDLSGQERSSPSPGDLLYRGVQALASLRLTIVLLVLGILLVFFGTLAQIEQDVWPVVDAYFRSLYVWVPFQLLREFGKVFFDLPPEGKWGGSFLFPGGWLIGAVMLANLLAAHAIRFRVTWKRSGVLLIHAGLVLLMVGELVTGLAAVESRMTLQIGETVRFIDITRRYELALSTPLDDKTEQVFLIPDDVLTVSKRTTIRDANLPLDVEVADYWVNTSAEVNFAVEPNGRKSQNVTVMPDEGGLVSVTGIYYKIGPARQESGVEATKENAAGYKLRFKKKGTDDVVSEMVVSQLQYRNFGNRMLFSPPQSVSADGKTYNVVLRNKREFKPYELHMMKFEHGVHERTKKAKNYQSTVELYDPRSGERREVHIYMNNPLRHDGVTYYQSGFVPDDSGTVLQVVRNPGWLLPYISCIVVSLGMLIHFGLHLDKFLRRRAAR